MVYSRCRDHHHGQSIGLAVVLRCIEWRGFLTSLFSKKWPSLLESELQIRFNQKPCTLSTVFYSLIFLRKLNLGRIMEPCAPPKIGIRLNGYKEPVCHRESMRHYVLSTLCVKVVFRNFVLVKYCTVSSYLRAVGLYEC